MRSATWRRRPTVPDSSTTRVVMTIADRRRASRPAATSRSDTPTCCRRRTPFSARSPSRSSRRPSATTSGARGRFDAWEQLVEPAATNELLTGRACRGIVHKLLDPPVPSIVSTGAPPDQGVWRPDSVRAVAAAKALSWERETPIESVFVEYPTHGVVRRVELTTRRKAAYRAAIRTVEAIDGPPPRLHDDPKCEVCDYRERCGVRTRSLRSLLGSALGRR